MRNVLIARNLPFVLSLVAGMALWEIVGRNSSPAFLVPLSRDAGAAVGAPGRRHADRPDAQFGRRYS